MFELLNTLVDNKYVPKGQVTFGTAGTFEWTCPDEVERVCLVVIGGGTQGFYDTNSKIVTGGNGGNLRYRNNVPVIPGNKYTIVVGNITWGLGEEQVIMTRSSALGITAYANNSYPTLQSTPIADGVFGGDGGQGQNTGNINQIPRHGNTGRYDGASAGWSDTDIANTIGADLMGNNSSAFGRGKGGYYVKTSNTGQGTYNPFYGGIGGVRIIWGRGRAYPNTNVTNV